MSVRLCGPMRRLALFVGGMALLALGLTACAGSPSAPTIVSAVVGEVAMPGMNMSGMSGNSYRVEVVFKSAVVAGTNQVTIRVHDAVTDEPLRNAVVRVSVKKRAHAEATTDNRDNAAMESHGDATADSHDSAAMESHGDATADSHDSAAMESHGDATADSHDSVGTKGHEAAEADASAEEAGAGHQGHGGASPAVVTLAASSVPGEHIGQVEFPDVGEWRLIVYVAAEGEEKEAEVAVTAARDEGRLIVLGGFLGLNIAIIATAAITKRKTVKG